MKKATRKGFTIVELLVVIAVIAVLAAVMIPVMVYLIDDAKESADEQVTASLNKAIAAETGDIDTMSDALAVAEEYGYGVEKLTPTSEGNLIVWDSQTKYFALVTEDGEKIYANGDLSDTEYLFTIISDESEIVTSDSAEASSGAETYAARTIVAKAESSTVFSYYLGEDFEASGTLTVSAGIDVGEHEDVSVRLSTGDTLSGGLIVNTAGGDVEIAADSATVKTYGTADSVTVSGGTVNVYGEVVGNLEVSGGTVTTQASSSVGLVYVTSEDAVVTATSGSIGAVAASSAVTDTSNIKADEIVELSEDDETYMAYFAGGIGTEGSPYQIATADQFAGIGNLSDAMKSAAYCYELTDDIDLREASFDNDYVSVYFQGSLNGNGKKLIAGDSLSDIFVDAYTSAEFTDIDLVLCNERVMLCPGTAVASTSVVFDDVDISAEDSSVYIELGRNQGLYTDWVGYSETKGSWMSTPSLTITGCDVSVNLSGTDYNAVFIGGGLYKNVTAVVEHCTYSGTYIGEYVNLVLGNAATYSAYTGNTLTANDVVNNGELYGTSRVPMAAAGNNDTDYAYATLTDVDLGTARQLYDATLAITLSDDGTFSVTEATSSVSYYVLKLRGRVLRVTETSQNSWYTIVIKLDSCSDAEKYSEGYMITVAQYQELVDSSYEFDKDSATEVYGQDGTYFDVVTADDGTVYYVLLFENNEFAYFVDNDFVSSAVAINKATLAAYDSDGLLIASVSCTID